MVTSVARGGLLVRMASALQMGSAVPSDSVMARARGLLMGSVLVSRVDVRASRAAGLASHHVLVSRVDALELAQVRPRLVL